MSMGAKKKNLPFTYYYCDQRKKSCEFLIYYCWQSISLRIGEIWADWYHDNIIMTTTKNILFSWVHQWRGLKNHLGRCKLYQAQIIKVPEADDKKGRHKVKFAKTKYQLRLPFVIYVDFESVLRKQDLCEPSSSKPFTTHWNVFRPGLNRSKTPIKSFWNSWPKNSGGNTATPSTDQSSLSQEKKKSMTMINWQVSIKVQVTTHATSITASI